MLFTLTPGAIERSTARATTLLAIVLLASVLVSAAPAKPRFADSGVVSTNEGHATLRWSLPGGDDPDTDVAFELQQSRDREFSDPHGRHAGPERAFFVSGLRGGRTYFRVRAAVPGSSAGPWSDPLVVEVDYPGRSQVILLLVVGCVVFGATVVAITVGWARNRRSGPAGDRAGA